MTYSVDERLRALESKAHLPSPPQTSDGGVVLALVMLVVGLALICWCLVVLLVGTGLLGKTGDGLPDGTGCAEEHGSCALVAVDKDCSWIPMVPCREWVPLPHDPDVE